MMMNFEDKKSEKVKNESIIDGIKEGIDYALHSPQITTLLAFLGIFSFIALTYPLLMPVYAREVMIMSLHSICFMGATSVSNFAAGSIAQLFGVSNTLIIFGSIMLFTAFLFLIRFYNMKFVFKI